jgi:preprotein translocase subunit SecB
VTVSDLLTRASLPPVHLADVNFAEIFMQEKQNQAEQPVITKH